MKKKIEVRISPQSQTMTEILQNDYYFLEFIKILMGARSHEAGLIELERRAIERGCESGKVHSWFCSV